MSSESRNRYLLKNTLIFTLGNIGSRMISFFLIPLYTNVLTTSQYGTVDLIRLYVQHTTNNNAVLEKGYTAFNKCVDAFCVSIIALIALAIISNFLGL